MEIQFPLSTKIDTLKASGFSLIRFKHVKHVSSHDPHYFIVVPNSQASTHIVISVITSRIEKLNSYYMRTNKPQAVDSLVWINNQDFSFLNTDGCVINCNDTDLYTYKEFEGKIDNPEEFEIKARDEAFSPDLKQKIIAAIKNSPIVLPRIRAIV